jgi:hypothetical protein
VRSLRSREPCDIALPEVHGIAICLPVLSHRFCPGPWMLFRSALMVQQLVVAILIFGHVFAVEEIIVRSIFEIVQELVGVE